MSDKSEAMHTSLVQAEIRRALAKAAWYSEQGQSQQALAYWGYAKRLEGYPPETADRIAHDLQADSHA